MCEDCIFMTIFIWQRKSDPSYTGNTYKETACLAYVQKKLIVIPTTNLLVNLKI